MLNTDPAYLMEEMGLAEKVRQRFLTIATAFVSVAAPHPPWRQ